MIGFVVALSFAVFSAEAGISSRIVGGALANSGQFPSAAAIYVTTSTGTFFCGGTLISQEHVVTSAHCIQGAVQFRILLGSHALTGTDANRVTLSSTTYFSHPDFNEQTLENDIAIVKFHIPISYTDYIQPAYLPTVNQNDGMSVTAIGWGQISDEVAGLNNDLQYVPLVTIPNSECQLSYASPILDDMICVAGNYNEGSCRGDSGSPILTTLNHHHWLVGIASFISGAGCETSDPSGYTRVFSYIDWIKSVTGTDGTGIGY